MKALDRIIFIFIGIGIWVLVGGNFMISANTPYPCGHNTPCHVGNAHPDRIERIDPKKRGTPIGYGNDTHSELYVRLIKD